MRNRHKSLRRLLDVKTQLQQVDEWKLADLHRRKEHAKRDRSELFDILGDIERHDSVILGLACRQIAQAAARERSLEQAETQQKQLLLERSLQKRALEQAVQETARAVERDGERRLLLDVGERLSAPSSTSLR